MLGAQYTSALRIADAFSRVVDLAEEAQVPGQLAGVLAQLVLVAAADDQDLDVGKRFTSVGSAPSSTAMPLRGSSKRPRNSTDLPGRG